MVSRCFVYRDVCAACISVQCQKHERLLSIMNCAITFTLVHLIDLNCNSPGIKESDTGLAPPSQWDLVSDKQMMQEEQPLQVNYHGLYLIVIFLALWRTVTSSQVLKWHALMLSWCAVLTKFCFCMKVARCTKIISPNTDDAKYVINVKQIAKVGMILLYQIDHIF